MKKFLRLFILPSVLFFCTTSLAANTNKCEIIKKNAKKAKNIYSFNKKKASALKQWAIVLKKDKKKMPTNVTLAHKVINHEIHKLALSEKKSRKISKKYLKRLHKLKKAAKRNCARTKLRKKRVNPLYIEKIMFIAKN